MLDPETSRFLQEDTYTGDKKDPLSLNLYTYCHNNPLIYDDPTGHFAHILLGGLVGGVLSVAATGITNLVTTGKLGSAKQYVGAFASGFVEGAVGAATLGIGSIAAKVAIDAATSFGSNLIEQKITTGKVSLKKAAVETATGMAISGAASKVAKKFQNSKINQKLTKKLDDVTSSLKAKTKNITANIAKKTKEATQKAVNTVSDKAKTIANKTLSGTNTVKNAISNGIKNAPKGEKNKVASVIDSLGEGILSVRNVFAPQKVINAGPIKIAVKDIKTGFGQSGEETLSQFLSKDVNKLKTMFFSQGIEGANKPSTFADIMEPIEALRYQEYWGWKYAETSPIKIPSNATIKIQSKTGYDQIQFKWFDGNYKYDARWHTRTLGAPPEQGNTWVIERITPGNANGQRSVKHILTGEGEWTPRKVWQDAILARQNGVATEAQNDLLKGGHWPAP